jgi:hypothetical protein
VAKIDSLKSWQNVCIQLELGIYEGESALFSILAFNNGWSLFVGGAYGCGGILGRWFNHKNGPTT